MNSSNVPYNIIILSKWNRIKFVNFHTCIARIGKYSNQSIIVHAYCTCVSCHICMYTMQPIDIIYSVINCFSCTVTHCGLKISLWCVVISTSCCLVAGIHKYLMSTSKWSCLEKTCFDICFNILLLYI